MRAPDDDVKHGSTRKGIESTETLERLLHQRDATPADALYRIEKINWLALQVIERQEKRNARAEAEKVQAGSKEARP